MKHENCTIYRDNNNNKLHKKICSSMKELIDFLNYHEFFDYEYGNIPEKYLILDPTKSIIGIINLSIK